jgi:acetoin utilization deacetylase AcuC-like enzyme
MRTVFITSPACLGHEVNPGHRECPERLQAIYDRLAQDDFDGLPRMEAQAAEIKDIELTHERPYIESVLDRIPVGRALDFLDGDTCISSGSGNAALHAVGTVLQGVDEVITGRYQNAFCAVRPPGHHAHKAKWGGFCLFNNVAIGAKAALERHGLKRVAIIDFDVHHGDGTQDIAWDDARIFYASTHQSPLFPGTGYAHEKGGRGNILNIPLPPGASGREVIRAITQTILPQIENFKPDMLFVSAGYDGHISDPYASWCLKVDDYAEIMRILVDFAEKNCQGRLVTVLEGGYDLDALADSVAVTLKEMMKHDPTR